MSGKTLQYLADQTAELLDPLDRWAHQCHAASVYLVKNGTFGPSRVVRGLCQGVMGQHSWVVLGLDCYDDEALIIDPTLWSYDRSVFGVWVGAYLAGRHVPHGYGDIWDWGRPEPAALGEAIALTPSAPLSPEAREFLAQLGPLDRQGWMTLASHAPVGGWPAGEIIAAIADTEQLSALVPIDRLGMLTDRNPGGLYLKEE